MLSILRDARFMGPAKAPHQADLRSLRKASGLHLLRWSLCRGWNWAVWIGAHTDDTSSSSISSQAGSYADLWLVCVCVCVCTLRRYMFVHKLLID